MPTRRPYSWKKKIRAQRVYNGDPLHVGAIALEGKSKMHCCLPGRLGCVKEHPPIGFQVSTTHAAFFARVEALCVCRSCTSHLSQVEKESLDRLHKTQKDQSNPKPTKKQHNKTQTKCNLSQVPCPSLLPPFPAPVSCPCSLPPVLCLQFPVRTARTSSPAKQLTWSHH